MWIVAKIKKKEVNFFKYEIKERCDDNLILYQPILQCDKFIKNKLRKYNITLLEDYFFCYSNQFFNENFFNSLRNIRGLKYFLKSNCNNQREIVKFIENCKKHENKNGFIEGFSENYIRFRTIWDPKLAGTIKQMKFNEIDPEGFAI